MVYSKSWEAARRAGDERAEGMCLNYLASVYYRRARYDDALVVLTEAIRLRRKVGDGAALSTSLGNLAAILDCTNRWVEIMQMTAEASSAA